MNMTNPAAPHPRSTSSGRLALLLCLLLPAALAAAELDVLFSPDGGFAPSNRDRSIRLPSGEAIEPIPNNGLRDLIDRTKPGGKIKIVLYAMTSAEYQDMLLDCALKRGIEVKLLLDGVADWTADLRYAFRKRVQERLAQADPKKRWRFQMAEVTKQAMRTGFRASKSREGDMIYGTMHEKFGIFYEPKDPIPRHGFFGSANVSYGSDHTFAESRFVFRDDPDLARQFAEEFARLWNEYGECVIGDCYAERFVDVSAKKGGVEVLFNAETHDEWENVSIDKRLISFLEQAEGSGDSIDVAMFSFTHRRLAQKLVDIAREHSGVKVRVLMDQTQISEGTRGVPVVGPWLEEQAKTLGLDNLEVRYKWRSNAYGWEEASNVEVGTVVEGGEEAKAEAVATGPTLVHFRNPLLHHKLAIVNKRKMAAGSFNWSSTAERRNFENVGLFDAAIQYQKPVVDRYLAEYEALWNASRPKWPFKSPNKKPQVVTGPEGRALEKKILEAMGPAGRREVMTAVEKLRTASARQVAREAGMKMDDAMGHLMALHDAQLLVLYRTEKGPQWALSD